MTVLVQTEFPFVKSCIMLQKRHAIVDCKKEVVKFCDSEFEANVIIHLHNEHHPHNWQQWSYLEV